MSKKTVPTYDPKLDPEKKILDAKHKLLKRMIGLKGCTRMGEQYILTCICRAYQVTSDQSEADEFLVDHEECG